MSDQKRPWDHGFQREEYDQKSEQRRRNGDDPRKIVDRDIEVPKR